MKKLFSTILTLISLNSFSQYIINQTLGSDSTLVTSKGAFKSRLINTPFTDTTQANAQRIKYYDGAQIYTKTGGGKFWIRDSANNIWLQLAVSAGVGTVTQVNSGYGLTGGPITTIGTLIWDTATASLKYLRLNDTVAMLGPYIRTNVAAATYQPIGNYITALTGDGTASGPGSSALTLSTVNGNVGTFGSASQTLVGTWNAKGLATGIAATSIQIAESQVTNLVTDLAGKESTITVLPIAKGGTNNGSLSVTAGTIYYGDGTKLVGLAPGTDKQHLVGGTTPAWKDTATAGGGGSQTLQQTTDLGNTTTKVIYSTDSIKAYSNYSSGGAMFGDSVTIQTDSTWFYGASIEAGSSGLTAGGIAWTTQVATYIGTTSVNKAIASTRFSRISVGDSSFMDRLTGTPVYLSTRRYIVIGGSNILNDYTTNSTGVPNLQTNLAKAIDTLHVNRGWPLSKIIIAIPSLIGTSAGGTRNNDSLGYYARGAIATAISKGVPYVDNYTFTINNGGVSLINSDSIHPNNTGHNIMAKGFRFRISDVGFANSASIERNLYVRSNAQVDGKLILPSFVTGGQTMSGSINWGANGNLNGNGIVLYDAGSTSLRSGLGFSTSDGSMSIFARGSAPFKIAPGQDATTATTANSTIYIQQSVPTPVTLGEHTAVNGNLYAFNFVPTTITYPTTTNSINAIDYGPGGSGTPGIYTYNNHTTTALRAGLIYDRLSTQQTFIFGRGSYKMLFGQGHDQTDMTTSNASFWIDSVSNVATFNGFAGSYAAKTTTYTLTNTDHTIECTSGTFTITAPTAVGKKGREYWITNTGSGTITIATTSSQTFVNVTGTPTTLSIPQFTSYKIVSNDANWLAFKMVN